MRKTRTFSQIIFRERKGDSEESYLVNSMKSIQPLLLYFKVRNV
jgi:hypothetical protein